MSESEPMTPEEIAEAYLVPLEAVLEAIAYCDSDPPEIREDFEREQKLIEATGMNDPNYKGKPRPLSIEDRRRIFGP
jgi:hypothetical protein